MTKISKTNAMRILDKEKIDYKICTYDISDDMIDGISVALKTGKKVEEVYKTLVTQGISKTFYVFVIPVDKELDLKKIAALTKEKKIDMIPMKDLLSITGYVKGGCSPVGMKKLFQTFFHEDILNLQTITVSGGKVGIQIELSPNDLISITKAHLGNLIK